MTDPVERNLIIIGDYIPQLKPLPTHVVLAIQKESLVADPPGEETNLVILESGD